MCDTKKHELSEDELAHAAGGSGDGPRDCYFELRTGGRTEGYSDDNNKKRVHGAWRFGCTRLHLLHYCNGHTCACYGKHCVDGWHLADKEKDILLPESHSNHAKKNQNKPRYE